MKSEGFNSSSSDSDISESSGEICFEPDTAIPKYQRHRPRKNSVNSVSTNPEEDTYVMVLQNKQDTVKTSSMRDCSDVTFLVGPEKTPVHCIRAVVARKSCVLDGIMLSYERNNKKQKKRSKVRKAVKKISNLKCIHTADSNETKSKLIIPIKTFDVETFQRLMNYIHCGTLTVDPTTVVGLMNAAYMFGLPEIRLACWDFAIGCLARPEHLQDMLNSAKMYADHKMTRDLLSKMKYFITNSADRLMYASVFKKQTKLILSFTESEMTSYDT